MKKSRADKLKYKTKQFFKNNVGYVSLAGMLAVTGLAVANLRTIPSSADSDSEASVVVSPSCSFLGTVDEAHTANIINGQYKEDIGTTTLRTYCNDANGYEIYAVGFSNDTLGNTNLIEQEDNTLTIATGLYPGADKLKNSTPSSWSMKLTPITGTYTPTIESDADGNSFEDYHIVPEEFTKVASYPAGMYGKYKTDSSLTTTYDTYVNQTQPTGTYTGKVKYTMIQLGANIIPTPHLQSITYSECTSTPTTAYDTRDGEEYTIARLADGKCWMLDNLRLGAAKLVQELSTSNTNMSPDVEFTLPTTSTTSGFGSYTAVQINKEYAGNKASTTYGVGSGKIGTYFNYCAASAGTICTDPNSSDAQYDVCPKGWRMPTGGTSGEYQTLYEAYSGMNAFYAAFSISISGAFQGDSQIHTGVSLIWSSIHIGDRNAYNLYASTNRVNVLDTSTNSHGFSVRCVLK